MDIEKFFADNRNVACRNFYLPDGAVVGFCSAFNALPDNFVLVNAEEIELL